MAGLQTKLENQIQYNVMHAPFWEHMTTAERRGQPNLRAHPNRSRENNCAKWPRQALARANKKKKMLHHHHLTSVCVSGWPRNFRQAEIALEPPILRPRAGIGRKDPLRKMGDKGDCGGRGRLLAGRTAGWLVGWLASWRELRSGTLQ